MRPSWINQISHLFLVFLKGSFQGTWLEWNVRARVKEKIPDEKCGLPGKESSELILDENRNLKWTIKFALILVMNLLWDAKILQITYLRLVCSHPSPTVVRFLVWTVALTPMGTYFRSRRFRKMHLENILPSPFWARSSGSSWSPWPSGGTLEGI